MSDNCDMLNALKDNKKILDNIDIWKKVRPAAAVLPVTYLALTVGINNIEVNREYSNTDNIDKEVKNNLNNYDSYVSCTYDKPKTKVRKKVKNI